MFTDRYDLALTTSSSAARDAYVDGVDRLLGAYPGGESCLADAIAADPRFALAHAALARQQQVAGRPDEARATVERAVELARDATGRERRHVEIIALLVAGRVPESLALTREHLGDHPRDAFVLSPAAGVFGSIGFSGRVDREPEQLALLESVAPHYGDDWWFQSAHAFALVETGRWEQGRDLVARSLDQRPDNAHAAHILTHALYEGGADDEARAFLGDFLTRSDPDSLMHCHNWWHHSLQLLTDGQTDAAWTAFSRNCLPGAVDAGPASPAINVFTDAASFLWRAELAGVPRNPTAWASVRSYYEERFPHPIVFVDAHAGLPYAALGELDALDACITELQELGEAGRLPAGTTAAGLARAFGAYAEEEWDTAIGILRPLMPEVVRIGGSRAQRDLVTNTLLSAYVKAGRPDEAGRYLDTMTLRRPSHPVAGLTG
ncbi:MAG: tetratricopeptide repeat protein [Acidimicrobiales bacterium]